LDGVGRKEDGPAEARHLHEKINIHIEGCVLIYRNIHCHRLKENSNVENTLHHA